MTTQPPGTLLNVDDDPTGRLIVSQMLRAAGYEVREAETGVEALQMAAAEKPDVIVLDVQLPDISGQEVCRQLRAHPDTATIPVVHLTATPLPSEEKLRIAEGAADAFLIEPVEASELTSLIRSLVRLRRAEARLRQVEQQGSQQCLDMVSQLAAGVAHEFNNLLTIINGYSELLLNHVGPTGPSRDMLQQIRKAGDRAAGLTRQLLAFGQRQTLIPRIVDLNALITSMREVLQGLVGERVQVEFQLDPDLGRICVDPGQIEQVLMALTLNARDAMPQGGQLRLRTKNVATLPPALSADRPLAATDYIQLTVADTGHGMDPDTLAHLFEPFFTTKDVGEGTGLGLATVHGTIRQSQGFIAVESELGKGTVFRIFLPAASPAPRPPVPPGPPGQACPKGTETILLVEDEHLIQSLVRHQLETSGYTVLGGTRAREALELAETYPHPIHLLLTDVTMPGMTGPELARHVQARRPELRVLYMSGYTQGMAACRGAPPAEAVFLQKPFGSNELARKVREVLDADLAGR